MICLLTEVIAKSNEMIAVLNRKIFSLNCLIPHLEWEINGFPLTYCPVNGIAYNAKYESMCYRLALIKHYIKMYEDQIELYKKQIELYQNNLDTYNMFLSKISE
jgi:hypothetical protein